MGKLSLKAVLRNFLNHFETLESRRKCNSDDDLYLKEFQAMKELTESLKNDVHYSSSHGLKEVNRRKNRYKDILPYDYSRVILSEYPGVPGSDYINANYIRGSTGSSCAYIASQGPLPNTVVDFWRMIWESEVSVIVMACNETESGKYKCECYWPENSEQEQQYGNITVRIVKWRQVCPDFLVRTFKITSDSNSRRVCQFHYTTWPDHGVPSTVHPILELVRLMRDCESRETRPILVHCSAGCGRTGTICSIDFVWALLRTGRLTEDFSLFNIISDMRRQRIAMVQTQEQYMLCYRAVAALFEQQLKLIDAHTYENLDEDGEPLMLSHNDVYERSDPPEKEHDENSSSTDTSEQENGSEAECDSSPTKGVQNLIGAWQLNTIRKSNKENSSEKSSDTKQEKLVGKATVIRRPSIAKLKALFENRQENRLFETDLLPYERRNKIKLQRSYSTRERGSNVISGEDMPFRMNTSHSEPKKLAVKYLSERNQQKSVVDYPFNGSLHQSQASEQQTNIPFSNHTGFQHSVDKAWSSKHSSFSFQSEDNTTNSDFQWETALTRCQSDFQNDVADSISAAENEYQLELPNSDSAPPKPPRTFQYNCETRRSDEESACESDVQYSNGGRIIVSVALPKNKVTKKDNKVQGETFKHLATRRKQESLYCDLPPQTARNGSESNIYEPQVSRSVPNVRKELSKSTQGLAVAEPIYYEHIERSAVFPNFQSMGPKSLRRDMSVPALSAPKHFVTNEFVPKMNVGNGIVTQFRHPTPKFISYDQNRQTAVFSQHTNPLRAWNVNYPVTFVRPQANNPNNKAIAINANIVAKHEKLKNETENKSEKERSEKANKETDMKQTAIPRDDEKRGKKQGHNLASFFSFGRKKKEKLKPSINVPQSQPTPSISNTVTVRPPHSHRFLPPTQWTQV